VQRFVRREGHAQLDEEAVELRLRQRVGALHLQRILRRQHEERRVQLVADLGYRHRLLLHRLEQRRLRLGRGAVDLVGEQDIGENRPALELETLLPALVFDDDVGADDVGGHEVGRELDAREREVDGVGQRAHQHGFAQAGHALEERVAAGEERHHHALDDRLVADDDLAHLVAQPAHVALKGRYLTFDGFSHFFGHPPRRSASRRLRRLLSLTLGGGTSPRSARFAVLLL
jgi:hypothetical protein